MVIRKKQTRFEAIIHKQIIMSKVVSEYSLKFFDYDTTAQNS